MPYYYHQELRDLSIAVNQEILNVENDIESIETQRPIADITAEFTTTLWFNEVKTVLSNIKLYMELLSLQELPISLEQYSHLQQQLRIYNSHCNSHERPRSIGNHTFPIRTLRPLVPNWLLEITGEVIVLTFSAPVMSNRAYNQRDRELAATEYLPLFRRMPPQVEDVLDDTFGMLERQNAIVWLDDNEDDTRQTSNPSEYTTTVAQQLPGSQIELFMQDRENTMDGIVHLTACQSEQTLRKTSNFQIATTVNSAIEHELITKLRGMLHVKKGEFIRQYGRMSHNDNLAVAIRTLGSDSSPYSNNIPPSYVDITGYGMRNILALYFNAISTPELLCPSATTNDGLNAIITAIANSQRGNNRNNEDGIDDGATADKPICGKGHYNKLAECMVGILKDVNIIFDATGAINKYLSDVMTDKLVKLFGDNDSAIEATLAAWNSISGDQEAAAYLTFKAEIEANCAEMLTTFLNMEFADNAPLKLEVNRRIMQQARLMGGLSKLLESITLLAPVRVLSHLRPL